MSKNIILPSIGSRGDTQAYIALASTLQAGMPAGFSILTESGDKDAGQLFNQAGRRK